MRYSSRKHKEPAMSLTALAQECSRRLHQQSIVITSHDHLWDYEDLVQTAQGGIDAKVLMLHVDALPWDDEGPDSALTSIYDYEGWPRRALTRIDRILGYI